jgi:hypothetical protein
VSANGLGEVDNVCYQLVKNVTPSTLDVPREDSNVDLDNDEIAGGGAR